VGKTSRFVRAVVAGFLLIGLVPASSLEAATVTRTVRYGPFSLPAGTKEVPAQISRLQFAVQRPCIDCYITSFTPDLVYTDGSRATLDNDAMLHHAVFASQWHQDATCYNQPLGLAGERFFASGDERSEVKFPDGYGYRVRYYDSWTLLVDLMNHSSTPKDVYVKVTYNYRPSSDPVTRVRPCGWTSTTAAIRSIRFRPGYQTRIGIGKSTCRQDRVHDRTRAWAVGTQPNRG
jgi:hypothetical protein